MDNLIARLRLTYPELTFSPSDSFYWSPENKEIFYLQSAKDDEIDKWSLLHEVGHALLDHANYDYDFMLLRLEVDAWEKGQEVASKLDMVIDKDHIQDCLDTYRDWIFKRSVCPKCSNKSYQQKDFRHYRCFNCHMCWRVTPSRFCRTYRITDGATDRLSQSVLV